MKWSVIGGVALLCIVFGQLGLTAGINISSDSTVAFLPSLGSLGDHISGLIAFSAVLCGILLAYRQHSGNAEKLRISSASIRSVGPGQKDQPFISLTLTSEGRRPVTVTRIGIVSSHTDMYMPVSDFSGLSCADSLPLRLERGERAGFDFEPGLERKIAAYIHDHCAGCRDGLFFEVYTSNRKWQAKLSSPFPY